ncbi:hypothetical protein FZN16_02950 [Escherichia coli]|nr:hypothetical protein [Escherichia coli]EFB6176515.1 hypothetical protein [Escherichia coli]EFC4369220.1 hypothetical protein [Escherichia coli]EFN5588567.1 hypothetical protein [Escherichia coli]EFN5876244.1 hypothetical protein [Escherichia coli]
MRQQGGGLFRILYKCLFSEVTVQAVSELDNKTASFLPSNSGHALVSKLSVRGDSNDKNSINQ